MTDDPISRAALLPCPFCGADAKLRGGPLAQETYSIWCSGTPSHHQDYGFDAGKAITAWNRRALPAAQVQAEPVAAGADRLLKDALFASIEPNHSSPLYCGVAVTAMTQACAAVFYVPRDWSREQIKAWLGNPQGFTHPSDAESLREVERLTARVAELEEGNFALAAWQCVFLDGSGLTGDERGNQICLKAQEVERLAAKAHIAKGIIAKVYKRVSAVVMGLEDDGDRVFFGSTNDADILRDLKDEWDEHQIMGVEILTSEQESAAFKARATTAEAEAERLRKDVQMYAEANHRQAVCINFAAGALGPDYSPTIEGLPKACASVRAERDAALARVKELEAQLASLTPPPDAELDALVAQARSGIQTKTMMMHEGETVDLVATFNLQMRMADAITALRARQAGQAEGEEDYKLGYRDGYEAAVQDVDVLTGGDGEYRCCIGGDPDRHTPDAATMKSRIADRFAALRASAGKGEVRG